MPFYRKKLRYKNKRGRYITRYRRRYPKPFYSRIRRRMYKIARQLNVEYKEHNVQFTGNTISQTLTIQNLNLIDQGTTDITRIGRQIKITRVNIKGVFAINASATMTFVRVLVLIDKQVNQATFSASDLLFDTSANDNCVSLINLDNKGRFKILYDKIIALSPSNAVGKFNYNKMMNLPIVYDNTGNGVADLTQKSLYLCFVSNEATNTPAVTLHARVRYVDN